MGLTTTILTVSLVLQILAVLLAVRLIRATGSAAWGWIAVAIGLMALRRAVTLHGILLREIPPPELAVEGIALAISLCLVVGLASIKPVFDRIRSSEAEARRSEARFQEIAETIQEAFWVVSPDGARVEVASPALARFWGQEAGALLARPGLLLEGIHPEDRSAFQDLVDGLCRLGKGELEHRVLRPDGTERWLRTQLSAVHRSADLPIDRIVAVSEDVTEHRQLAQELRQAQKMEAIGHLAGGIAHDFNNLLTTINGYTELLLETLPEEAEERDWIVQIGDAGQRAARITRQLLALGRRQSEKIEGVALDAVVLGLEGLLRRTIREDVDLVLDLGGATTVEGVQGQLEQVVLNLAINAADALPEGGTLRITTRRETAPVGDTVILRVSDTGVGMAPETLDRIFEPFFTTKGPDRGTGLGLSTVRAVVERHEGTVDVTSNPGEGTTFEVVLPAASNALAHAVEAPPERREVRNETILVAEDDPALQALVSTVLVRAGYRVLVAGDGARAQRLAEAHQEPVDLLLTDSVMPTQGGAALAEWIQARHPGVRVLYMSGYPERVLAEGNHPRRGVDFLQKPFRPDQLLAAVQEALDGDAP